VDSLDAIHVLGYLIRTEGRPFGAAIGWKEEDTVVGNGCKWSGCYIGFEDVADFVADEYNFILHPTRCSELWLLAR
jgi:hypothetical protein